MRLTRRTLVCSGAAALARIATAEDTCGKCSPCDETLACFDPKKFVDTKGIRHVVYVAGKGPPVLVLHELPGLTKQDIRLANKLICDGYTALVPLLFGNPGDDRFLHFLFTVCGKDQFDCDGKDRTPSPTAWIREFSTTIRTTWKEGMGIGVIGMCLTGEFPIALLGNPDVKAAVMCQPTDPFNALTLIHLGPGSKLSVSVEDMGNAQKFSGPILGIRYARDPLCPEARFRTLAHLFPHRFYWLELEGHHHSSLGEDLCDAAFQEVRLYLGQQLKGASPIPGKKFPNLSQLTATAPRKKVSCGTQIHGCES
jgi:dienelactone hydrolase